MSKSDFIKNKYSVSVLILLGLLLTDFLLHKGMGRVMLPENFSDKITPYQLPVCERDLVKKEKEWIKAVNTVALMQQLDAKTNGLECDVYFDSVKNCFEVYHDSSAPSSLKLDSLLVAYQTKQLTANIWFDFKNLGSTNAGSALKEMIRLKNNFKLDKKLIIESSAAGPLKAFCDSGFFTSYYVPFFNPYEIKEEVLMKNIDSIRQHISQYPASAISGYYFQYPLLKKIFPTYPILTWADQSSASLIAYFFRQQLKNDDMIKVVLFPME